MFINILEICIKYPKLGLLDPNFVKTGDELKIQDENSAVKKEETQTVSLSKLVGTRDGRTQSARACKPALLHLALRTLGFRTSVFGSEDLGFRTSINGHWFHSQDLGFRTSINGHWVSLSGPGFQDLQSSPSYGRLIFFPSLFSASTVTFLPRPVFLSLFSASTVTDEQTHARTKRNYI
jgi:hypothetical protein